MLIRAQLLDGRTNTGENKTDEDFQTYEGPISAKMLTRRSMKVNGVAMEHRISRLIKEGRYSVIEKIDFASFVFLMFAYISFNIVYVLQYAN